MPEPIITNLNRSDLGRAAHFLHVHYDGLNEAGGPASQDDWRASDYQTLDEILSRGQLYAVWQEGKMVGIAGTQRVVRLPYFDDHKPAAASLHLLALNEGTERHLPAVLQAICEDLEAKGAEKLDVRTRGLNQAAADFLARLAELGVAEAGRAALFSGRPVSYSVDVGKYTASSLALPRECKGFRHGADGATIQPI